MQNDYCGLKVTIIANYQAIAISWSAEILAKCQKDYFVGGY